ncbi:MAG: 50S ribosomal protein L29 [Clostridiales bacterium]|nr:50S ribosomal protein L29 [Clostridiales bacterium]
MKNNYKDLSIQELTAEESKLRSELFNLTFQNKVGQLADTSRIRIVKKNIARVKTALNQKKIAGAKE